MAKVSGTEPPPPPQSVPLLASAFPSPLPHQLPCWLPRLYSPSEPVWEEPLKGGWLRWHPGLAMVTFPSGHVSRPPRVCGYMERSEGEPQPGGAWVVTDGRGPWIGARTLP